MTIVLLVKIAALTHVGIIAAGLLMPGVVGMRQHLRSLPDFVRTLFWVYYGFIGLCLVSFATGTFFFAEELASGTALARAVCAFLAIFWSARLIVGMFIFDLRPYLTSVWRRAGLAAANTVFACLPVLYGWLAVRGGV
jgi:hypothetical protein